WSQYYQYYPEGDAYPITILCDFLVNNLAGYNPATYPCSITGVTCNPANHEPTNIILSSGFLTLGGTIPTEFGYFTVLQDLQMPNCNLSGTIPTQLGRLALFLGGSMTSFSLNGNSLTGTIPSELFNIPFNGNMLLNNNKLNGTIPSQIYTTIAPGLIFHNNYLSGTIPTPISNNHLAFLDFGTNNLTGTIPTNFNVLTALVTVLSGSNQLNGTIPTQLWIPASAGQLDFSYNQLTGTIPTQLGSMTKLVNFKLNNNQLVGTLPSQLSSFLLNLTPKIFDVSNNFLNGTIPTTYFPAVWSGATLNFYNNEFTGSSSIWQTYIQNRMTGTTTSLKIFTGNAFICPNATYSRAITFMTNGGDNTTYCINETVSGCNVIFSTDECALFLFYSNFSS